MKGKVNGMMVRPALMYSLNTVTLSNRQKAELEGAELTMPRLLLAMT